MLPKIDVLVVTALQMEFEAARETLSATDGRGIVEWQKISDDVAPLDWGLYLVPGKRPLAIALARPLRMGSVPTTMIASTLLERHRPDCLAMCGVCAGNPADLALGDVVVAEMTYAYDEGKREESEFQADYRQSPAPPTWVRAAQDLSPNDLPSYGSPTMEESRRWLLETLHRKVDPIKHPARSRYFAPGAWPTNLEAMVAEKLVKQVGATFALTPAGQKRVETWQAYNVDAPAKLPFVIRTGPMASADVVVKDGVTWEALKQSGVRTVLALEMEASAIGAVARGTGTPAWIVVKGVMDHADPKKEDRYKPFAARASAEVMMKLIVDRLAREEQTSSNSSPLPIAPSAFPSGPEDPFFDLVGEAIGRNAARFRSVFERARKAALAAHQAAQRAKSLAIKLRRAGGADLQNALENYEDHETKILPIALEDADYEGPFCAKIWSSADQYVGQCSGPHPHGLGVFRVYVVTKKFSPDLQTQYAGEVEFEGYGPLGVFTFSSRSTFAGEWLDGNAHFGCREYFGSTDPFDADLYFGGFTNVGKGHSPDWVPNGDGVTIDIQQRMVRCANYHGRDPDVIGEFSF